MKLKEKERALKKQRYVVLGYDQNGGIRLLMNAVENKHLACSAIRKYIFQFIDTLEACGHKGSRIYGLQKAMRNIYAHNHFSTPFYLKATKHQQYINAASFSSNSTLTNLVFKNNHSDEIILNLLSNVKFRESCLAIINGLQEHVTSKEFYILVLPKNKNEQDNYTFLYKDIAALKKSGLLTDYTAKIKQLGKPAVLKVELKRSDKVHDMNYRDEIEYLKTLDKKLAQDLEVQFESTIGIGEVTDLTNIALRMIEEH